MDRENPTQNTNALRVARRSRSARWGYPELVNCATSTTFTHQRQLHLPIDCLP
jgi:hypothetical protein